MGRNTGTDPDGKQPARDPQVRVDRFSRTQAAYLLRITALIRSGGPSVRRARLCLAAAKATWAVGEDRPRAIALAVEARELLWRLQVHGRLLVEINVWLTRHVPLDDARQAGVA